MSVLRVRLSWDQSFVAAVLRLRQGSVALPVPRLTALVQCADAGQGLHLVSVQEDYPPRWGYTLRLSNLVLDNMVNRMRQSYESLSPHPSSRQG